ncbi:MAG: NrfD/PsrC family molybdoenzyme membrane anchor subunit [Micromonosporaceae bacterium]
MSLADAEHFVRSPEWTWYILFYFFLAGLSGGSYVIATLLRLGNRLDEPVARLGYYVAFITLLGCPVLLTLDLGQPLRFWHMLVNTTPGNTGLNFKYWSPMSVGTWALVVFGVFATVSFLDALVRDRAGRAVLGGAVGTVWSVLGAVAGLFVTGYTGVLLAVSNQPVWSDTWALGGLFLASGLSGSAALLAWLARYRRDSGGTLPGLLRGERLFQVLELALIVTFAVTLIPAGALDQAFGLPWAVLWAVALVGIGTGFFGAARPHLGSDGTAAAVGRAAAVVPAILVLIGVLALRAAVIFSAQ